MAFGPIMKMKVGDIALELAPISKDDLIEFVNPGMQQFSIGKYLSLQRAPKH